MYKIYIKSDREPIIVKDNNIGTAILGQWEDSLIPDTNKFKIGDWTGLKSEIKSVVRFNDEPKMDQNISNENSSNEYRKYRKAMLALPKSELAKNMQYFGFIYQVLFERNYRDDIELVRNVYKLQFDFFSENKDVILPDPAIFRDIFSSVKIEEVSAKKKPDEIESYIAMKDAGYSTFSQAYVWEQRYAKEK